MIQHAVSVTIGRPPDVVFAFLTDTQNHPKWQSNLLEMKQLSEGVWQVGTRLLEIRRTGGRIAETTSEIALFEANRRFQVKSLTGPQVIGEFVMSPENSSTRVDFNFTMQTSGLMRFVEPLLRRALQRQINNDFQQLKRVLEA